jgi:hypothetical protein
MWILFAILLLLFFVWDMLSVLHAILRALYDLKSSLDTIARHTSETVANTDQLREINCILDGMKSTLECIEHHTGETADNTNPPDDPDPYP